MGGYGNSVRDHPHLVLVISCLPAELTLGITGISFGTFTGYAVCSCVYVLPVLSLLKGVQDLSLKVKVCASIHMTPVANSV